MNSLTDRFSGEQKVYRGKMFQEKNIYMELNTSVFRSEGKNKGRENSDVIM